MTDVAEAALQRQEGVAPARSRRSRAKSWTASALCLVPAGYLGGVVMFAVRNADSYATALPQALRYIVVPGLLSALLAAIALRGSRVLRVNVGGAACALLVLLFACEAVLERRYVHAIADLTRVPPDMAARWPDASPGLPAGRTVRALNTALGTTHLRDAVLGGVAGSRVALCSDAGRTVAYRADRFGFRNPAAALARPPRLMVIGDSFVEGICLPDGQDLVDQVRRRSAATLGFGMRGAGPLLELAMLGRYGPLLKPRWVVFGFYEGNDWGDLAGELQTPWANEALADGASFGQPIDSARNARAMAQVQRWGNARPPDYLSMLHKAHVGRNVLALHQTWTQLGLGYPKAAGPIPDYDRVLARARAIASRWGARLAILYVPATSRFFGLLPHQFVHDQVLRRVTTAAAAHDIPVIDTTPRLAEQTDPMGLYAQGHLSARGADLVAAMLTRSLDDLDQKGAGR